MVKRKQKITVLGATGSIGMNTLDVVARHPERFEIVALCAHSQHQRLLEQCVQFRPSYAVLVNPESAAKLTRAIKQMGLKTEVLVGTEALEKVASLPEVDSVMAAIVGAAGLRPTLAAARTGKRVLLANKEALVMAGPIFMNAIKQSKAMLLPIDSEHNAIFQSLPMNFTRDLPKAGVRRIVLTASGGPFRSTPLKKLEHVTPDEACAHPNWIMGRKISVDSATMMNKGLEVIEAHWLFGASADDIEVVIHPQSVIHSMVVYNDGSVIAQLGNPDMRTPIAHALGFPDRIEAGVAPLSLPEIGRLEFMEPDYGRFPCLKLAYQALRQGGTAPAILNAANEVAVESFLNCSLSFLQIPTLIESILNEVEIDSILSLEDVLAADANARKIASKFLKQAHKMKRSEVKSLAR